METPRKQTINILVNGKKKRLRGVTRYTTCDDVIKMVVKKTAQRPAEVPPAFAVFERFNGTERQLSRKDRILKVVRSWGSDAGKVEICVRNIDDVRTKMATIKNKKKRLIGLSKQMKNKTVVENEDTDYSIDLTNSYKFSKHILDNSEENDDQFTRNESKFSGSKQKVDLNNKKSVFRRIFTNVLKRKTKSKDELKRKVKQQKCVVKGDSFEITSNKTEFTYVDLQQSFKAQLSRQMNTYRPSAELDTAFIDEDEHLEVDNTNASVLNQCIVEDMEDVHEFPAGGNILLPENKRLADLNSDLENEQTFVKLDTIKQIFDKNKVHCQSEDDFMDSFMRSKVYESESDGDC